MTEYNGFLRFSDEAVASVNWNDQQHSGEAGVTDETTGTVYPFGGGGGDDLIEIEYTVANSTVSLTKTPAELYELMQAGKNFKIVVNSDLANYGQLSVGDEFISVQYTIADNSLSTLDFYLAPLPTNQGDTGGKWNSLFFGNSNGVMESAFD